MWRKLPWLLVLAIVVIVLVMGGVATWLLQREAEKSDDGRPAQSLLNEREERSCGLPSAKTVAAQESVVITSNGFEPAEVAIKVGQTVRWINNDSAVHRIVVGPHPLHNGCLGLDSKELESEESFGFTFTKPGEWRIHDEQQLSNQGRVIVTE